MNRTARIYVLASYVSALSIRVPRLPHAGESLCGDTMILEAGGKGLNVAVAAKRLGAAVDGLVAIGTDRLAPMAMEALASAGLPETMAVRLPGPSGTGVGLIDVTGENMIAVCPGANALLTAGHVEARLDRLSRCDAVIAQFEIGDAPIERAFAEARRRGIRTILNPSPYRSIAPAILAATDVIVANRSEAAALLADFAGTDPSDAVWTSTDGADLGRHLFARGVSALVVTLGCEGAGLWRSDAGVVMQSALPSMAEDCTGCGDAFLAGFTVALTEQHGWADALRLGAACGAITAARTGVLAALPSRRDALAMLRDAACASA